jgi:hypothetical protein
MFDVGRSSFSPCYVKKQKKRQSVDSDLCLFVQKPRVFIGTEEKLPVFHKRFGDNANTE